MHRSLRVQGARVKYEDNDFEEELVWEGLDRRKEGRRRMEDV